MMDEFAQYAKTERKINKLTEKLNQCSSARSLQVYQILNEIVLWDFNKELMQASKAGWAFTLSMHACLGEPPFSPLYIKRLQIQILIPGLGLVMTMWSWGSEPVLILPSEWLSPISW